MNANRLAMFLISLYIWVLLGIVGALVIVVLSGCGHPIRDLHDLQSRADSQDAQISVLQTESAQLTADLAILQARVQGLEDNLQVFSVQDPCGNGPGFDEVILSTNIGLIAFFESGTNRFLTVLSNGTYQTTDAQHCLFTVSNGVIY